MAWRAGCHHSFSARFHFLHVYGGGRLRRRDSFQSGPPLAVADAHRPASGSLGEVCALALLLGFAYLLIRRVITPVIPLTYIGTVAVIMLIAGKGSLSFVAYEILGGGLLLGAIFMATDYTTSPINFKGKLIYGVGCGILTALIRLFGSLPEGVSFSIIIMNILVPHIERITTPKPFGSAKTPKKKQSRKKEAGA